MRSRSFSEPDEIFQNQFLRLYSVHADFESHTREYFVTQRPDRAGMLLLRDDSVLLVSQYRYLINDVSWEIPGGGVGPDETPQQAAVRECREESGVICNSLRPFFDYPVGTDVTDSHTYLFSCSDFTDTGRMSNEETDDRRWITVQECLDKVFAGEIKDSMTIIALLAHVYTKR